jgi:hypothetical protein
MKSVFALLSIWARCCTYASGQVIVREGSDYDLQVRRDPGRNQKVSIDLDASHQQKKSTSPIQSTTMAAGTSSTSRPPSRATTTTAQSRVTRLRAKEPTSSANSPVVKTPGILARSKEGLRLVGEKMKEKDKKMISAPTTYSESLQVCHYD